MTRGKFLSIILCICFLFGGVAFSGCGSPKEVTLIVLAGQSNMQGFGEVEKLGDVAGEDVQAELVAGYKNFYYSNTTTVPLNFQKYNINLNSVGKTDAQVSQFGPEAGIMFNLHKSFPKKKMYFLKLAVGGATLEKDFCQGGICYDRLVDSTKKAIEYIKKQNEKPVLKILCWMQGESDFLENQYQDNYYNNLVSLKTRYAQDFADYIPNNTLYFVDGAVQLYGWIDSANVERAKVVNAAKQRFADEHEENFFINTVVQDIVQPGVLGLTTIADNLHLDTKSQWKMGDMFGKVVNQILEGEGEE